MSSSINRYVQVLLTYYRQTTFWFLAAWMMLFPIFIKDMNQIDQAATSHTKLSLYDYFVEFFVFLSCWLLPAAWGAALVTHVRKQLEISRNILTPGYRVPELAAAGLVFIFIALLLTIFNAAIAVWRLPLGEFYFIKYNYLFEGFSGSLLLVLGTMTASAWWASFKSQWTALLLGMLTALFSILLWFSSDYFNYFVINFYYLYNDDYWLIRNLFEVRLREFFPLICLLSLVLLGFRLARGVIAVKRVCASLKSNP